MSVELLLTKALVMVTVVAVLVVVDISIRLDYESDTLESGRLKTARAASCLIAVVSFIPVAAGV